MALRARWIPGVVATYLAHAWMAAIALTWVFVLGRRFPVGGLDFRQLRPWYPIPRIMRLMVEPEVCSSSTTRTRGALEPGWVASSGWGIGPPGGPERPPLGPLHEEGVGCTA